MKADAYAYHSMVCPRCAATAWRVPRCFSDRLRGLLVPSWRFGCTSVECGWEDLVPRNTPGTTRHVPRSVYADRLVLEPSRGLGGTEALRAP